MAELSPALRHHTPTHSCPLPAGPLANENRFIRLLLGESCSAVKLASPQVLNGASSFHGQEAGFDSLNIQEMLAWPDAEQNSQDTKKDRSSPQEPTASRESDTHTHTHTRITVIPAIAALPAPAGQTFPGGSSYTASFHEGTHQGGPL